MARVGRMKNVKIASRQWVWKVSCKRRPRHMDRAFVALAYLCLKHGGDFFPKEQVMETVIMMHATCEEPKALGEKIESHVEVVLSNMIDAGYIIIDDSDDEMTHITPAAAKMMRRIDGCMKTTQYSSRLEKLYAHCDHFRQRVGTATRPTMKAYEEQVKGLRQRWIDHKRRCAMARGESIVSDISSLADQGVIHPDSGSGDIDLDEEQPIPGPSSSPITPARPTKSMTPDFANLTPVSLSKQVSPSLPPSPTQCYPSCYSYSRLPEMEVDKPIAGPSSSRITSTHSTPARKPTLTDPTVAYLTPLSLPRGREETRNTLSPPPSPTPRGSFSQVHGLDNGMNVDDNSGSSSSGGPSRLNTPAPERVPEQALVDVATLDRQLRELKAEYTSLVRKFFHSETARKGLLSQVRSLTKKHRLLCDQNSATIQNLRDALSEEQRKAEELANQNDMKGEELAQTNKELEKYMSQLQNIIHATAQLNMAVFNTKQ